MFKVNGHVYYHRKVIIKVTAFFFIQQKEHRDIKYIFRLLISYLCFISDLVDFQKKK